MAGLVAMQRLRALVQRADRRAPSAVRRFARDVARQMHWFGAGSRLVSVVVTASDEGADYLDEALTSVARQTHKQLEVLVVLHGPSVRVAEIAQRWAQTGYRFRIVHGPAVDLAGA